MISMKKLYTFFTLIGICFWGVAIAQAGLSMPKIPLNRQLFHDNIDANQQKILHLHGKNDVIFMATKDEDINLQLTQLLKVRVNNMQAFIEADSALSDNSKFNWLRGINGMLSDFIIYYQTKRIKGILLGDLIIAYDEAIHAELSKHSILPIIDKNEWEVGEILANNFALKSSPDIELAKNSVILKSCRRFPEKILSIAGQHLDAPFVDSLIIVAAYRDPEELYNYASAYDKLAQKIKKVNDPLVKAICQMASVESGRLYFPFLDLIYHQKLTIESIARLKDDDHSYYRLLVKTEIEYAERAQRGDTPLVMHVLTERLKRKAVETYIDVINSLHEERSDAVRFRKLDSLNATELYYLTVLGEEEIYTSSYLGVYNRIFSRMASPRSDTLLKWVSNDFYKKFIKMAANYNELDDFLKRMDKHEAEKLVKNFVNDLDKNKSLEDAVDVADSYASIKDPSIKKLILEQVQIDLKQSNQNESIRAKTIYGLLNTIFQSMDPSSKMDASAALGIPPIYNMPISLLKDAAGRIIIQQFFYGDKDGVNIFNSFLSAFSNNNWKITRKAEWAEVRSIRGTPIVIYSNKPLDTEKDLDAQAQKHLSNYLDSLHIDPTVIIHRGHSYYVNLTINQLPSSGKVILLGSCGGYNSLNKVLSICPGAHIIASKQVGMGVVNIALIEAITETLRENHDLNWVLMWKKLQTKFVGDSKEKFEDYVAPYQNLGAIFITAYNNNALK
jgi:hypothetical protein